MKQQVLKKEFTKNTGVPQQSVYTDAVNTTCQMHDFEAFEFAHLMNDFWQ